MWCYKPRTLNPEKSVDDIIVNRVAFHAVQDRYITTGRFKAFGTTMVRRSTLKKLGLFLYKHFYSPAGVCVQPGTNNVMICDSGSCRVRVFGENDQSLYDIGVTDAAHTYTNPHGISCDADGSIAVSLYEGRRVKTYDARGRYLNTLDDHDLNYGGVCYLNRRFAPSSSATLLLLAASERVLVLSNDGSQPVATISSGKANAICVDLNGYVYVSVCPEYTFSIDSEPIQIFEPRMSFKKMPKINLGKSIGTVRGLCVDDQNVIAFADLYGDKLQFLE